MATLQPIPSSEHLSPLGKSTTDQLCWTWDLLNPEQILYHWTVMFLRIHSASWGLSLWKKERSPDTRRSKRLASGEGHCCSTEARQLVWQIPRIWPETFLIKVIKQTLLDWNEIDEEMPKQRSPTVLLRSRTKFSGTCFTHQTLFWVG